MKNAIKAIILAVIFLSAVFTNQVASWASERMPVSLMRGYELINSAEITLAIDGNANAYCSLSVNAYSNVNSITAVLTLTRSDGKHEHTWLIDSPHNWLGFEDYNYVQRGYSYTLSAFIMAYSDTKWESVDGLQITQDYY
ncbi:MAG: hypothetical protein LBS19_06165 [Clostridiales bacterium]|jgi:hypothetical protein|nr:hypothetical protein [Clostridiales bacterium]